MGNSQGLDATFGYDDTTDSGFSEQNSPFEFNRSHLFDDLLEHSDDTKSSANTDNLMSTPKPFVKLSSQFNFESSNGSNVNSIVPIILQRRRSSIVRSKTIEISRSMKDEESDSFNEDDCNICTSLVSNTSNMSIISSSWSPNSNISNHLNNLKDNKEDSKSIQKVKPSSTYPLSNSFISGMNFVGRVARGVKDFYNEINPATLTGAIDVVVVKQEDGTYRCSPFHVRFGKLGVIRSKEKIVDIEINGQKVDDLHMVLGEAGEAFFIERINSTEIVSNFVNCCLETCTSNLEQSNATKAETAVSTTSVDIEAKIEQEVKLDGDMQPEQQKLTYTMPIPITKSTPTVTSNANDSVNSLSPLVSPENTMRTEATHQAASNNLEVGGVITNVNFFSDGDITPELTSPAISRPVTPKSDTEAEMVRQITKRKNSVTISSNTSDANQWNWSWGQFPERQTKQNNDQEETQLVNQAPVDMETSNQVKENVLVSTQTSSSAANNSSAKSSKLLGSVLNLTKKQAKNMPEAGIYLDDTEKLDSEVAELYLNQKSNSQKLLNSSQLLAKPTLPLVPPALQINNDDDQESGNGLSLPQSPVKEFFSPLGDIQMSLCGFITANTNNNTNNNNMNVNTSNSQLSNTSSDLIRSSSFNSLTPNNYPSTTDLSSSLINNRSNQLIEMTTHNFEDLFQQYAVSFDKFMEEIATITLNPNLVIKINNRYLNWSSAAPIILSAVVFHKQLPNEVVNNIIDTNMSKQVVKQEDNKKTSSWSKNLFSGWGSKKTTPSTTEVIQQQKTVTTTTTTTVITTTTNTPPSNNGLKTLADTDEYGMMFNDDLTTNQQLTTSKVVSKSASFTESTVSIEPATATAEYVAESLEFNKKPRNQHHHHHHHHHKDSSSSSVDYNEFILRKDLYRKTTRLSSELIEKLNLKLGSNEIQYSITTALQGTTRITSYIFLWNHDDKIIVSDIDGTITKSDVWGQVLPIFGRDWSQDGVADLFTAIERNQYKFMYLSARAIGQSKITRDLLKNINQDGFTLPEGPLLVTPTSLFVAFQKEVIEKKPEEFKISCLNDIKSLFPDSNSEPFYAGYGNKPTDVTAYKTVGIPVSKIFTINPQGEVKHEVSKTFQSSYSKLSEYVDLIFPPFRTQNKVEYNSYSYWRDTPIGLSPIDMNELGKELMSAASQKDAKKQLKVQQSASVLPQTNSNNQLNDTD